MTRLGSFTALSLLCLAVSLDAATARGDGFAIYGWGKADCRRFLEVRRAGGGLEQTLRQWVFGFVSAHNLLVAPSGDGLKGADPAAVIAKVEKVCAEQPGLRITGAVNSIFDGE